MPYAPTHQVPPGGLPAWAAPDGSQAPVATLDEGLDVQLLEQRGDWARVMCSNGWEGWVDGGRLASYTVTEPPILEPALATFVATHAVPPEGIQTWAIPDPSQPAIATLAGGMELRIVEQRGQWAQVEASNGWTGWVDATRVHPLVVPAQPVTTYVAPAEGIQVWQQPDPAQAPFATLHAGIELRLLEQRGQWAQVEASNGWTVWVDAGRLVSRT